MLKSPRVFLSLFIFLYVSFCGCQRAETPSVPGGYDAGNFNQVVQFVLNNYYDPDSIDKKQGFVGAAEAALRVMPYPLVLMSREFYENRSRLQGAEQVVPGSALAISANDPYIVFVPDYKAWKKKSEKNEKAERERRRKMKPAERYAEVAKERQRSREVQKFSLAAWDKIEFGEKDFQKVIRWIDINKEKYLELPESHRGPNPYKDDPFGMQHVYFAATNGFLHAVDPHSSIIDPSDWDRMREKAEDNTFEGIGALLRGGSQYDVVVETPLIGSPALKAGLRAGDIIRKVDNVAIENLPLSEVVKRIKGPKNTIVKLEVERTTELRNLVIPITRGVIEQKAVTYRLISSKNMGKDIIGKRKIGVIRVTSFLYKDTPPSQLVVEYYRRLIKEAGGKLDGLVLDLRGNPGGYLQEAIDLSDIFLPPHLPVVQVRGGETQVRRTSQPAIITGIPIIVLINSGSASASEIVASALMDHNAALVLGERSFGKATVQSIRPISPVQLKYTIARYYAPRGYTIQVYGVRPDHEVSEEAEGGFPPRYREENMWKHLPELKDREEDPHRAGWVEKLKNAVGENKAAEKYIKQHKNDPLKPDFMLIRSLKYFTALEQQPAP